MRRTFGVMAVVGLVAACGSTDEREVLGPGDPMLAKGGGGGTSEVLLSITVADTDPSGSPYGITSDGRGAYVHGVDNVQAVIGTGGELAFNTYNSNKPVCASRWIHYDFSQPVDPSNTYRPSPSDCNNYHFSNGPSAFRPWIPLQNLGVNGNPASQCGYFGNGISNSTENWRVSYHKGYEDTADSPTAYAVFTRVGVNPDIWTVTSVGSCSPNSDVASLRGADGTPLYGYYRIPFRFTLRRK